MLERICHVVLAPVSSSFVGGINWLFISVLFEALNILSFRNLSVLLFTVFSSPEHEVLKVSFCGRPSFVVNICLLTL